MIRVVIVEDEETASMRLAKLLKEISTEIEIIDILDTVSGTLKFLQKDLKLDLIFLDIQLADGLSFEIFNEVRINVPIIFTTAYDQYALKAFELNSVDYLLKPIDKLKLEKSLKKFNEIKEHYSSDILNNQIKNLIKNYQIAGNNYKERFLIPKADELIPIHVTNIAYFYAEDKAVFLITNAGERFIINFSLDQLEQSLNPTMFFRINRQQLVAEKSIIKIHNYYNYRLKLELNIPTKQEFIVSKAKVSEFRNWLS